MIKTQEEFSKTTMLVTSVAVVMKMIEQAWLMIEVMDYQRTLSGIG